MPSKLACGIFIFWWKLTKHLPHNTLYETSLRSYVVPHNVGTAMQLFNFKGMHLFATAASKYALSKPSYLPWTISVRSRFFSLCGLGFLMKQTASELIRRYSALPIGCIMDTFFTLKKVLCSLWQCRLCGLVCVSDWKIFKKAVASSASSLTVI